ncbi:hypothetical protein IIG_05400 [Bacillus cereus VD048]|uniref:Insertion element IS150 protein InsJ-like helix-turn-helix domain-containing protein n=1 Tax=Bacillus cereus VD048 TaxID=1053226 RepID=J8HF77_BACCE|nr:hypothetical protein IIG_05400 [Bacillus cereus VD048]
MTKFTSEDKMNAVIHYQDGNESIKDIAKSLGAKHEMVRMWIKQFEYHGIQAFEKGYITYSAQYKLDVLNYMIKNGTSPNETAVIFNISSPGFIRKWRIQLQQKGVAALKSKKKGCQSMTKDNQKSINKQTQTEESVEVLQAELERLRMENAYQKKLNALVQNKEKTSNKIRHK